MELWIHHCLEIREMKKKQQKRPKKTIKLTEESNSRYDDGIMVTQKMILADNANEVSQCLKLIFKWYKNYI